MLVAVEESLESSRDYFEKWNNSVREVVPKDRLLEFDPKQGWDPICKFLGVPIPEVPFPRLNDTKEMNRKMTGLTILAYSLVYGLPAIILSVLVYFVFL